MKESMNILDILKSGISSMRKKPKRLDITNYEVGISLWNKSSGEKENVIRAKYLYLTNGKGGLSSITFVCLKNLDLKSKNLWITLYINNGIQHTAPYLCTGEIKVGANYTIALKPLD